MGKEEKGRRRGEKEGEEEGERERQREREGEVGAQKRRVFLLQPAHAQRALAWVHPRPICCAAVRCWKMSGWAIWAVGLPLLTHRARVGAG